MSEKKLIVEFNQAFDLIIKGELRDLRGENENLLTFVNHVSKIDYSSDSKISEVLKKQLFKMMNEHNINGELSDVELDYAAGGLDDIREEDDPENNKM